MKLQDSIEIIKSKMEWGNCTDAQKHAMIIAIEALKKQIPKEFDEVDDFNYCPVCNRGGNGDKPKYCKFCGQALRN